MIGKEKTTLVLALDGAGRRVVVDGVGDVTVGTRWL